MKTLRYLLIATLVLTSMTLKINAQTKESFDLRRGFSHVARKATPSVVFIQVEKTIRVGGSDQPFNDPFGFFNDELLERFFGNQRNQNSRRLRPFVQTGQGSGFIISRDGYILTNTHVVGDADKIRVKLSNGKEYLAKRIGADSRSEVAVIKIDATDLPTVEMGDTGKVEAGDWVVAIGNPFGLKETVTVGVVSAVGRSGIGIADYEDFIQTDAAINPGNSGGPLLDVDGKVIGINTAIFSRTGGNVGIGFAVPIDQALAVKDQLVRSGKVTRGYMGVLLNPGDVDEEMALSFGLKTAGGVLVADVLGKSPAAVAGMQAGDIILELNGTTVRDNRTFRNQVAQLKPDTTAKVSIFRDGKRLTLTVKIASFPDEKDEPTTVDSPAENNNASKLGMELKSLTPELKERLDIEDPQGVAVNDVEPGSAADHAGIKPGDLIVSVNRKNISTPAEFEKISGKMEDKILLRIRNRAGTRFLLIGLQD